MRSAWWAVVVLAFNLFWYGIFLSFPLFGEDGGAAYSSLVESLQFGGGKAPGFSIKWLEGLGQLNFLVPVLFDPFSWVMFLRLAPDDAVRLSYALRATGSWVTTYILVRELFRGAQGLAVTSGWLSVLLNFTLTHPGGMPTHSVMHVATHACMYPGLLWVYLRVVRQPGRLGWWDIALVLGLALFLPVYPIGSILGLVALFAFGVSVCLSNRRVSRTGARWALGKTVTASAVILFAPGVGLYHTWSGIAAVAARQVFAGELTSYSRAYLPPFLWYHVPLGIRVVVVLSLSLLLLARRWSIPLRAVVGAGVLTVGGAQIATALRASGIAADLFERLPRPFYLEFYVLVLYAVTAAYAAHRWRALLSPVKSRRRRWLVGLFLWVAAVAIVLDVKVAAALAATFGGLWLGHRRGLLRWHRPLRLVPAAILVGLLSGALMTWTVWREGVHPLYAGELLCHRRTIWCRDPAGRSMGAGAGAITEFLRTRLRTGGEFRGRAEFLLTPAPRLASLPISAAAAFPLEDLQRFRDWYARAHAKDRAWFPPWVFRSRVTPFRLDGEPASWQAHELIEALSDLAKNGDPVEGILPDDVLVELVEWARSSPRATGPVRFAQPWKELAEVTIMVDERNRNFLESGNAMLLRSLPLQGVAMASSYEQALNYLYYLLWTRYVNQGSIAKRSINLTSLETVHPERLALVGVRYLIARNMPFTTPPTLPAVFSAHHYTVYEIPSANVTGYGVTRLIFAASLRGELREMRSEKFDPRTMVVVAEEERPGLEGRPLGPVQAAALEIDGQTLIFRARTAGQHAVAVLPFRFSHCWQTAWTGPAGQIIRTDVALLGVAFFGEVEVRLRWSAGYGGAARCLRKDAELVTAAAAAAREIQ